jgi:hypothetical protein
LRRRERKNEFNSYGHIPPSEEEYMELISKGFIKRTKAGAITVTTEGKNARSERGLGWSNYVAP